MSVTKHKIFRVKISQDSKLSFDETIQKEINSFLSESNNIYVNHSTSVLTEDLEEYGQHKTINKFLVISLIYKDLNDSEYNLNKTSKKIKAVVSREVETGRTLKEPIVETEFDREIKQLNLKLIKPIPKLIPKSPTRTVEEPDDKDKSVVLVRNLTRPIPNVQRPLVPTKE